MRRLGAAAIDFMISYTLTAIFYCVMISIWKWLRIMLGVDWEKYYWQMAILLYFVSFVFCNMTYSILFDRVCQGKTPGKKLVKYENRRNVDGKNKNWIIGHAVLRTIASILYFITALYYMVTLKMPYDALLQGDAAEELSTKVQ